MCDKVQILSAPKQHFLSVSGKPTKLEGAVGMITWVTPCTVKILVNKSREIITKYNNNVVLLEPAKGTDQVMLPNGVIKIRFKRNKKPDE